MTATPLSFKVARLAAQAADGKLAHDIIAYDVRGITSVADVFMFMGATSHLHVAALEDAVRQNLKDCGLPLQRTDGQRGNIWRVLDYGAVLIHIMDQKTREFYAIERLWEQGKKISLGLEKPVAIKKPKSKVASTRKVTNRKK